MPTKEEIDIVVKWCERIKRERKVLSTIERNPFRERISWLRRYPFIEIDRPLEEASKFNLVYDSTTKRLWYYMNDNWRWYSPEIEIKK